MTQTQLAPALNRLGGVAQLVVRTRPLPPTHPPAPRAGLSRPLLRLGALTAFAYLVENAWQSWGAIQLHSTAGGVVAALAPATAGVLAGIAVAGLGSICAPTLIAIAGLPRYVRQGAAISTVITVAYLGFAVGPAAIGLVAGATTLPTALVAVPVIAGALALTSPVLTRLSAP